MTAAVDSSGARAPQGVVVPHDHDHDAVPAPRLHLTLLPAETLHGIFQWLKPQNLSPLSQTCRFLRDYIVNNQNLCKDIYLNYFDMPPEQKGLDWESMLHDIVRLHRLCMRPPSVPSHDTLRFPETALAPGEPRAPLEVEEATRLIIVKIRVVGIEPPGEADGQALPVVRFEGTSRAVDDSWDDNADSDIRETAILAEDFIGLVDGFLGDSDSEWDEDYVVGEWGEDDEDEDEDEGEEADEVDDAEVEEEVGLLLQPMEIMPAATPDAAEQQQQQQGAGDPDELARFNDFHAPNGPNGHAS
ncbi:Putative aspergillopepsin A-like aspartic endopeptidase [Verticillium dahliae VDG1]|nr:Putative aspergillopepsin A-like aspartic endopeptidase [Verticillium dahliae VDG1]